MTTDKPILSVSQLTNAVKTQLESTFPNLRVQGEISNFKRQSSGHLYFSLKDSQSQLSCVMFRNAAGSLKRLPKEGDQVIVEGALNVYAPRGSYQLVVRSLELAGLGELLLRLEELKRDIAKRGWFRSEHKRPLPAAPKRIAIVTSPTGAAVQDILNVLKRRLNNVHILLYPVRVQGAEAPGEVAEAICEINRYKLADVMIVGRGGGSIEDLWAFNEEIVAEAVFNSEIPIVCAVGHESDHTIAEYVADLRAPTPSAAAEIVAKESGQYLEQLQQLQRRLQASLKSKLHLGRQRLLGLLRHPMWQHSDELLGGPMQSLDDLREGIDDSVQGRLSQARLRLDGLRRQTHGLNPLQQLIARKQSLLQWQQRLDNLQQHRLQRSQERLTAIVDQLRAIDPKNLLSKGYSLVLDETGSLLSSSQQLSVGQELRLVFADGAAQAEVTGTQAKEDATQEELVTS